ncbi:alpha-glucosidase/alpha-galactosidase [Pelosinus sp. IPA-1]|uniref:family 4 glycosyl hydrolase n=1 Tax=Pelosinus sp. IPA-1 TaxID=3029569 RepID=UPI0024361D8B|nr:alpha-glucosidase/alpha-galactosidase [Pelosinus sp. IPA-1]GMA97358.1 alpha-glucosidase/alpha-galactosidase [Pelosinus sp. IPA-1]
MQYCGDRVNDITIAYIGGGSRGWAWRLMSDLAVEECMSGTVKLYDIDFEAAQDNEILGNTLFDREDVKGKWQYKAVKTLEAALSGADFIVISILPGTFADMASDVHLPEQYGIYQSVGDSVGPGGLLRALRTIPMYVEIAKKIKKYSPKAWVINYTNPMALCTKTLYEVFPEIKAFGCCHEVFATQKLLASVLRELKGLDGIERSDIKINVLGINHFTWISEANYKNIDVFALYKEFVNAFYQEGYEDGTQKGHWINDSFSSANRVKFDLFKRFGIIAAAGDRHLAEFFPSNWYLKDLDTIKKWKFNLTPVKWRIQDLNNRCEKSKNLVNGRNKFELKESGEEGVKQIKALLGLADLVTNVNILNRGQVTGVPIGAVVETNAVFTRDSLKPVMAGRLPIAIESLVVRHVYNQDTILKASFNKDKELALSAFLNDPLVTIPVDDATQLFNKMIDNSREYLSEWKL